MMMLSCLNKRDCPLKDLLTILCDYKKFECKEGNLDIVLDFLNNKKAKAVILLIKGNVDEREAREYAFLVSEASKSKKIVWATNKKKKLSFKVLIAL